MANSKAYVISVSLGPGCYRHIKIAADATLFELHKAILYAFDFDDDHLHAFFMDNKAWSHWDAYYSDMIEDEEPFTTDYSLEAAGLYAGRQFKYVFDFGDDWRFQCKVLRELDEVADHAEIIRVVGEAPKQYPYEDDDEEFEDDEEEFDDDDDDDDE